MQERRKKWRAKNPEKRSTCHRTTIFNQVRMLHWDMKIYPALFSFPTVDLLVFREHMAATSGVSSSAASRRVKYLEPSYVAPSRKKIPRHGDGSSMNLPD